MLRLLSIFVLFAMLPAPTLAGPRTVLIYGDSLSAGFGLAAEDAWPALLDRRLKEKKLPWRVGNASISGETTAGGRSRFAAVLEQFKPSVVVIALGANDGLRGLPVAQMRDNLATMVAAAKQSRSSILLVGMKLPPNYGAAYTRDFEAAFADLAKREKLALLPFLLEPIALDRAAYQPDGLHPTAAAQPRLLDHLWPRLQPLLKEHREP